MPQDICICTTFLIICMYASNDYKCGGERSTDRSGRTGQSMCSVSLLYCIGYSLILWHPRSKKSVVVVPSDDTSDLHKRSFFQ